MANQKAKRVRGKPVGRGRCRCCCSVGEPRLYRCPTIYGYKAYCAPCCHSLGFRQAGVSSDGRVLTGEVRPC
jgi:hypothetical protein